MKETIAEISGKVEPGLRSEVSGQIAKVKPSTDEFVLYLCNLTSDL